MKKSTKILAGNWKMNHGPEEAVTFFKEFNDSLKGVSITDVEIGVYPPFLSIQTALAQISSHSEIKRSGLWIGAQNAYHGSHGAFTGEISGPMLRAIGVSHVLVGHSERRTLFGETDESALKRAHSLLEQGFHVLFCVGENLVDRKAGNEKKRVLAQLETGTEALSNWGGALRTKFRVAYEPVWAIGTGVVAEVPQISEMHAFLHEHLKKIWGEEGERVPLLYGGSVTPENFPSVLSADHVDGALVGGASLNPKKFTALLQQMLA